MSRDSTRVQSQIKKVCGFGFIYFVLAPGLDQLVEDTLDLIIDALKRALEWLLTIVATSIFGLIGEVFIGMTEQFLIIDTYPSHSAILIDVWYDVEPLFWAFLPIIGGIYFIGYQLHPEDEEYDIYRFFERAFIGGILLLLTSPRIAELNASFTPTTNGYDLYSIIVLTVNEIAKFIYPEDYTISFIQQGINSLGAAVTASLSIALSVLVLAFVGIFIVGSILTILLVFYLILGVRLLLINITYALMPLFIALWIADVSIGKYGKMVTEAVMKVTAILLILGVVIAIILSVSGAIAGQDIHSNEEIVFADQNASYQDVEAFPGAVDERGQINQEAFTDSGSSGTVSTDRSQYIHTYAKHLKQGVGVQFSSDGTPVNGTVTSTKIVSNPNTRSQAVYVVLDSETQYRLGANKHVALTKNADTISSEYHLSDLSARGQLSSHDDPEEASTRVILQMFAWFAGIMLSLTFTTSALGMLVTARGANQSKQEVRKRLRDDKQPEQDTFGGKHIPPMPTVSGEGTSGTSQQRPTGSGDVLDEDIAEAPDDVDGFYVTDDGRVKDFDPTDVGEEPRQFKEPLQSAKKGINKISESSSELRDTMSEVPSASELGRRIEGKARQFGENHGGKFGSIAGKTVGKMGSITGDTLSYTGGELTGAGNLAIRGTKAAGRVAVTPSPAESVEELKRNIHHSDFMRPPTETGGIDEDTPFTEAEFSADNIDDSTTETVAEMFDPDDSIGQTPTEQLYEQVDADISQDEFEQKLHEQYSAMGGLADESTATQFIKADLNPEKVDNIAEITSDMEAAEFSGRVAEIGEFKEMDNGGSRVDMVLEDESGDIQVTAFGESAEAIASDRVSPGDTYYMRTAVDEYKGELSPTLTDIRPTEQTVGGEGPPTTPIMSLDGQGTQRIEGTVIDKGDIVELDSGSRLQNVTIADHTGYIETTVFGDKIDDTDVGVGKSVKIRGELDDKGFSVDQRDLGYFKTTEEPIPYDVTAQTTPIDDLDGGVEEDFSGVVTDIQRRPRSDYQDVTIEDSSGEIETRVWSKDQLEEVGPGDEVLVREAEIEEYPGKGTTANIGEYDKGITKIEDGRKIKGSFLSADHSPQGTFGTWSEYHQGEVVDEVVLDRSDGVRGDAMRVETVEMSDGTTKTAYTTDYSELQERKGWDNTKTNRNIHRQLTGHAVHEALGDSHTPRITFDKDNKTVSQIDIADQKQTWELNELDEAPDEVLDKISEDQVVDQLSNAVIGGNSDIGPHNAHIEEDGNLGFHDYDQYGTSIKDHKDMEKLTRKAESVPRQLALKTDKFDFDTNYQQKVLRRTSQKSTRLMESGKINELTERVDNVDKNVPLSMSISPTIENNVSHFKDYDPTNPSK